MKKYIISFLLGLAVIMLPRVSETPSVIDATRGMVIHTASAALNTGENTEKSMLPISPKTYRVWVTAYTSDPNETDDTPFITASNTEVRDGIIAANFLPFGTQVKIPALFGNKIFTVEDRMHKRKTNFIDVWMADKTDAVDFGINRTEIFIVN